MAWENIAFTIEKGAEPARSAQQLHRRHACGGARSTDLRRR
jgi:hypothetical protein